ncbi:hypothetical protein [Streptomyces sp900116325]|uniref:hypothetical protein n=1 Tax=Streptomyces sp. 900116325 TaxID=3154295 RepID=UPI00332EF239
MRSSSRARAKAPRREAGRAGAALAFDGPSRANRTTRRRLPEQLAAPSDAGSGGQLRGGATAVPETPGMPHLLLRRLRPRLEHALGKQLLDATPIESPAQVFAFGPIA